MNKIYDTLNDMQQMATFHTDGPLLILAGAGSGKTRVLTHRIAYLIEEKSVNPYNIMAITFTNKAAAEMRSRVNKIVGFGAEQVWVSTFHSACVRILRRYIDRIGYSTDFTIYDTDDQKRLMKNIIKELNLNTKIYKENAMLGKISDFKNKLITTGDVAAMARNDTMRSAVRSASAPVCRAAFIFCRASSAVGAEKSPWNPKWCHTSPSNPSSPRVTGAGSA